MNCTLDVYFERGAGFSKYINDKTTYKFVLIEAGSFAIEENGKYRVITSPAGIILNEKAEFHVISEENIKSLTLYFKPTIIREEFTFEALNSGKYDKFFSALPDEPNMSRDEKLEQLITGNIHFDSEFCHSSIYQDALLLTEYTSNDRNAAYYTLSKQELDTFKRLVLSIAYELREQPDNYWILRTRYFVIATLFTVTADFYRYCRQDEIYKDPLVAKVTRYFFDHMEDEITLETVLRRFSVNKNTLNDAFNRELSMSCMAYLENMRIGMARKFLQDTDLSIGEISSYCGYPDTNYFSKVFKKHTGQTPSKFRENSKNQT